MNKQPDRAVSCVTNASHSLVSGQAALVTSFLIGLIVLFAGITMSFLATSFFQSTYGFQISSRASAAADAGVRDALLQLTRNKDFNPGTYGIQLDSVTATVTVTRDVPSAGQITILATSTVQSYEQRLRAVVSVSTSTGQVDLLSWQTQ
ncbi:MAG: hypothetical protein RL681_146 [Candidatus Parcubacteria bacterium]|jgi:hypothetical protein